MSSISEQVWLNQEENSSIRAGLNIILNGLSEIRLGLRYAPEVLYMNIPHKFATRKFDPDMPPQVLGLRNRLAIQSTEARAKFRLDFLELAMAAFALRLARNGKHPVVGKELDNKLEIYRRRSMRSAKRVHGSEYYVSVMKGWQGFEAWVRYNIVLLRIPKRTGIRKLYREQMEALIALTRLVIQERCEAPMDEPMLLRLVKLAASEIRRGRHGVRLRALLSKPDEAKEFMFHFIRKRTNLAVKFQHMTWDQQSAERADRFRACLTASGAPLQTGVTLQPTSAGKMKARIARFFVEEIDPMDWENVKEAVKTITDRPSPVKTTELDPESLEELFQLSRPDRDTENGSDLINFAAEWLQKFVLAAGGSCSQLQDLVVGGWALALND